MIRNSKSLSGFTLIELVLVITILSILSVLGGDRFFKKSAFGEGFAFTETVTALRYAQGYALLTGCEVQFVISSSGYTLNRDKNCTLGGAASYTLPVKRPTNTDQNYENLSYPDDWVVTSTSLVFFPQGWCEDSGGNQSLVTIVFVGGITRTVQISCSTGYVYES